MCILLQYLFSTAYVHTFYRHRFHFGIFILCQGEKTNRWGHGLQTEHHNSSPSPSDKNVRPLYINALSERTLKRYFLTLPLVLVMLCRLFFFFFFHRLKISQPFQRFHPSLNVLSHPSQFLSFCQTKWQQTKRDQTKLYSKKLVR